MSGPTIPHRSSAWILAVLLVLLTASPAGAAPKVSGTVRVEGAVTAVYPASSAFLLRTPWAGTLRVLVGRAAELTLGGGEEEAYRHAAIGDVRVGDRLRLDGFRLHDGRVLALRLEVKNRIVAASSATWPDRAARGVVIDKTGGTLILSGDDRAGPGTVLVLPTTEFRGLRASMAAIRLGDLVHVRGSVNSDGSIAARVVETVLGGGTVWRGRITEAPGGEPAFLMLDGRLAISLFPHTRIVSGGQLRAASDLRVGRQITVIGMPLTADGAAVGVNARIITY